MDYTLHGGYSHTVYSTSSSKVKCSCTIHTRVSCFYIWATHSKECKRGKYSKMSMWHAHTLIYSWAFWWLLCHTLVPWPTQLCFMSAGSGLGWHVVQISFSHVVEQMFCVGLFSAMRSLCHWFAVGSLGALRAAQQCSGDSQQTFFHTLKWMNMCYFTAHIQCVPPCYCDTRNQESLDVVSYPAHFLKMVAAIWKMIWETVFTLLVQSHGFKKYGNSNQIIRNYGTPNGGSHFEAVDWIQDYILWCSYTLDEPYSPPVSTGLLHSSGLTKRYTHSHVSFRKCSSLLLNVAAQVAAVWERHAIVHWSKL